MRRETSENEVKDGDGCTNLSKMMMELEKIESC